MPVCVWTYECRFPWSPEEGIKYPGAGTTSDVDSVNLTLVLCKNNMFFKSWGIILATIVPFMNV